MEENYQLGPIAISKSFVRQPLFWPGVIAAVLLVIAAVAFGTGRVSLSVQPTWPSLKPQVFPLNQQLSKPILYAAGTAIYRTSGQSQEKLYEVGSEVMSLVLSKDGSHLAATYKFPSGGTNASGYPYSSLIFWDMSTGKSLPIIAKENTTVRYPAWSDDGRYLAFWVNEGDESFIYDTNRHKPIFSVKKESNPVSPIVFLPNNNGIVYVKDGTLFSDTADGSRPIPLVPQQVTAGAPVVSPNGSFIAFNMTDGRVGVVNTATREVKMVSPDASVLGFLNDDELLHTTKDGFLVYSISTNKTNQISGPGGFAGGALAQTALPTMQSFYLLSTQATTGPQFFNDKGEVVKDCLGADFRYDYNISSNTKLPLSSQVVSADGKYLVGTTADHSLAVMDTSTCQPYIISQSQPTAMTWAP